MCTLTRGDQKDNLQESVLLPHGSWDGTQGVRLGGRPLLH